VQRITRDYGPGDEITWGPWSGDPSDPRAPEDFDRLSEEDARDLAREQVLATPHEIAEFVWEHCFGHTKHVEVDSIGEDIQGLPTATLMGLLIGATNSAQILRVQHELRQRMTVEAEPSIDLRMEELL